MAGNGNSYNEWFFEDFQTQSGTAKFWNTRMYGTDSGTLYPVGINTDYNSLLTSGPADSYVVANDGTNYTTFTRASDSKVLTLTWAGGLITDISDWT